MSDWIPLCCLRNCPEWQDRINVGKDWYVRSIDRWSPLNGAIVYYMDTRRCYRLVSVSTSPQATGSIIVELPRLKGNPCFGSIPSPSIILHFWERGTKQSITCLSLHTHARNNDINKLGPISPHEDPIQRGSHVLIPGTLNTPSSHCFKGDYSS